MPLIETIEYPNTVDYYSNLLAYRHDPPADMNWMVVNAGRWHIVGTENIGQDLLHEVKAMIVSKNKWSFA